MLVDITFGRHTRKAESPFAYTAVWGLDSLNLQNRKDYSAWQLYRLDTINTPRERFPLSEKFIGSSQQVKCPSSHVQKSENALSNMSVFCLLRQYDDAKVIKISVSPSSYSYKVRYFVSVPDTKRQTEQFGCRFIFQNRTGRNHVYHHFIINNKSEVISLAFYIQRFICLNILQSPLS